MGDMDLKRAFSKNWAANGKTDKDCYVGHRAHCHQMRSAAVKQITLLYEFFISVIISSVTG